MKSAMLREPTKDATGRLCPAGSIVTPDQTHGWPGYRVSWAVSNNRARYLEPKEQAALAITGERPDDAQAPNEVTDLDAGPASPGRRELRRRGR
jgi:hypothetical protein